MAHAWRSWASRSRPGFLFVGRGTAFEGPAGLRLGADFPDGTADTILLVEAATYHRRWAGEFPEKYGPDVLGHIRRGLGVIAVDFEEAVRDYAKVRGRVPSVVPATSACFSSSFDVDALS